MFPKRIEADKLVETRPKTLMFPAFCVLERLIKYLISELNTDVDLATAEAEFCH